MMTANRGKPGPSAAETRMLEVYDIFMNLLNTSPQQAAELSYAIAEVAEQFSRPKGGAMKGKNLSMREQIKADAAARGEYPIAERINGRLVPAKGINGHDMVLIKRAGNRSVKVRAAAAAQFHLAHSQEEAVALERELRQKGVDLDRVVILIGEQSERDREVENYVRSRARNKGIGRHK